MASLVSSVHFYTAHTAEPGKAAYTYISRFPGADMDLSSRLVWTSNGFPKERFLSMAFTRIFEEEKQTAENIPLKSVERSQTTASLIIQHLTALHLEHVPEKPTKQPLPSSLSIICLGSELRFLDTDHCWQESKHIFVQLTAAYCS